MTSQGCNSEEWLNLVRGAKESQDGFERLIKKLEPDLKILAVVVARCCVEDAVQEARIRIWKSLNRVKISKPDTIKMYLMKIGRNAMKSEASRFRNVNLNVQKYRNELLEARSILTLSDASDLPLTPYLRRYLDYIETYGRFSGSHKYLAKIFNVSQKTMRIRFHRDVKLMIELWRLSNE